MESCLIRAVFLRVDGSGYLKKFLSRLFCRSILEANDELRREKVR